jgi:hypothetical protein
MENLHQLAVKVYDFIKQRGYVTRALLNTEFKTTNNIQRNEALSEVVRSLVRHEHVYIHFDSENSIFHMWIPGHKVPYDRDPLRNTASMPTDWLQAPTKAKTPEETKDNSREEESSDTQVFSSLRPASELKNFSAEFFTLDKWLLALSEQVSVFDEASLYRLYPKQPPLDKRILKVRLAVMCRNELLVRGVSKDGEYGYWSADFHTPEGYEEHPYDELVAKPRKSRQSKQASVSTDKIPLNYAFLNQVKEPQGPPELLIKNGPAACYDTDDGLSMRRENGSFIKFSIAEQRVLFSLLKNFDLHQLEEKCS